MRTKVKLIFSLVLVAALAGCATSRSVLDVPGVADQTAQSVPSNGQTVYINSVKDKRVFEVNPPSPNTPSLDPSEASSEAIRSRAIGRKRNSFGKALGDMLLKDGDSVSQLTSNAIRQAFTEKGYRVVEKDQITAGTQVVDADVSQFWAWMNPGFWALTLSTEIATDVSVKRGNDTQRLNVQVKASDTFQVGTESNYIKVVSDALKLYVDELKLKLKP